MSIDPVKIRAVLRSKSRTRQAVRFVVAVGLQSLIGVAVVLFFVWLFLVVNGALFPTISTY